MHSKGTPTLIIVLVYPDQPLSPDGRLTRWTVRRSLSVKSSAFYVRPQFVILRMSSFISPLALYLSLRNISHASPSHSQRFLSTRPNQHNLPVPFPFLMLSISGRCLRSSLVCPSIRTTLYILLADHLVISYPLQSHKYACRPSVVHPGNHNLAFSYTAISGNSFFPSTH